MLAFTVQDIAVGLADVILVSVMAALLHYNAQGAKATQSSFTVAGIFGSRHFSQLG